MADEGELIDKNWIPEEALKAPLILSKNIEPLIKALTEMSNDVKTTVAVIKDQKSSMSDVNKAVQQLTVSEQTLIGTQKKVIEASTNEAAVYGKTNEQLKKLQQDYAKLTKEHERSSKEGKKLLGTIQKQNEELRRLDKNAKDAATSSARLGEQFGALDSVTGGWLGNLKKLGGELLTLAKNPLFVAVAAIVGVFQAAKAASEAYYAATLEGEEQLVRSQAADKAFIDSFGNAWEKVGEVTSAVWEEMKRNFKGFVNQFRSDSAIARENFNAIVLGTAEQKLLDLQIRALQEIVNNTKDELSAAEKLEKIRDGENFTFVERLALLKELRVEYAKNSDEDVAAAADQLKAQQLLALETSKRKEGVFEVGRSVAEMSKEELKATKLNTEEIKKLAEAEANLIKQQAKAHSDQTSFLKLQKTLTQGAADQEEKDRAFRTQQILRLYEDQKTQLEKLKEFSAGQTSVEVKGAEERIAAAKKELDAKVEFSNQYAEARGRAEHLDTVRENLTETLDVYNEFYSALGNLQSAYTSNVQQDLAAQTAALQAQKEEELRIAGDNAEARTTIEKKFEERSKALKREQAIAAKKQAEFQKATALIEASIRESLLIIEALLAPTPRNIAAAIAGGAQVAAIAIKKTPNVPAYQKGTKGTAQDGIAWVGEAGSELVEKPGENPLLSPAKPTLVYLPKGSKVTPHGETVQRLAADGLRGFNLRPNKSEMRELRSAVEKQTSVLAAKEFVKVELTEGGVRLAIQQAARKEYRLGSLYK